MAEYASFAGFVQWDPTDREVTGREIRTVPLQVFGSNKRVDVTLWPSHAHMQVKKGDVMFVQGKFEQRGEYLNLSANSVAILPGDLGVREGVTSKTRGHTAVSPNF